MTGFLNREQAGRALAEELSRHAYAEMMELSAKMGTKLVRCEQGLGLSLAERL